MRIHGIEHVDVPPHAVGVKPTRQLAVPEIGDVNVASKTNRPPQKILQSINCFVQTSNGRLNAVQFSL
jgi:hypothetical protein